MKIINKLSKAIGLSISFDEKFTLLYSNTEAMLYNTNDFSIVWSFKIPRYTKSASISHDNNKLAIKNVTGKISLWDINNCVLIKNFPMKKYEGENCIFTPDDKCVVDTDCNGNIMLIDTEKLSFEIIKTYDNCNIHGICFNRDSNEYIFTCKEKYVENHTKENIDHFVSVWKYPFDENKTVEYLLNPEIGDFAKVYNIPTTTDFVSYNEKELIILNNDFTLKTKARAVLDYGFKPIICSNDGKYLASVKHGVNIYSSANLSKISSIFIKDAVDLCFFNNNSNLIVAGRKGSFVLDL